MRYDIDEMVVYLRCLECTERQRVNLLLDRVHPNLGWVAVTVFLVHSFHLVVIVTVTGHE